MISVMDAAQKTTERSLYLQAFDLLRFPLAVFVVVEHIFPPNYDTVYVNPANLPFDAANSPVLNFWRDFVDAFIRGNNVPIFFFISGYLFFLGAEFSKDVYLRKLKSRVNTLLIPYIIWNAIVLIPLLLLHLPDLNLNFGGLLSAFWGYDYSLLHTGTDNSALPLAPINSPLWYIRDLIVVVLFTPLIYKAISVFKHWVVVILGCIWFATGFLEPMCDSGFAPAFFFFSWGAYMSICRENIEAEFGKVFRLSMFLYPCIGMLGIFLAHRWQQGAGIVNHLNIIFGLLFAYNLAVWLLRKGFCRVNAVLASSSMFIYVSHYLLYSKYSRIYKMFGPFSDWEMIAVYFAALAFTVLALLGAFFVLKRFMPSLLKVLIGRK